MLLAPKCPVRYDTLARAPGRLRLRNGIELWFNSNDHLPPHFHAERLGDWEIKVHFMRARSEMVEVVYTTRPQAPDEAGTEGVLLQSERLRVALLKEFEDKVNVKGPGAKR